MGDIPSGYSDFTHRPMRLDHEGDPTPRGIPYPVNMSPQKAAKLLNKAAAKPGVEGKRKGVGKGHKSKDRSKITVKVPGGPSIKMK
jgi:hypothetical protein